MWRLWLALYLTAPLLASGKVVATKSLVEGEVLDVVWASDVAVHLRTDQGMAYSSTDDGGTFAVFPECPHHGCIEAIKALPAAFQHLTLFQGLQSSWVVAPNRTVAQTLPHPLAQVVHHPLRLERVLAVSCSSPYDDMRPHCEMLTSVDGGRTFRSVATDVYVSASFGWAVPQAPNFDEDLIFFVRVKAAGQLELVKYHLRTQQAEVQVEGCAAYAQKHEFMFAAKSGVSTGSSLLVSADNGHTWNTVHLPNDDLQLRFTIVDASQHMTFINVYHQEGSTWGTTYSSDTTGQWFTPSVRYTRRNFKGHVDFTRVKGVPGTFIANVLAHYAENLACQMCKGDDACDEACEYQSRITFDQGHTWHPLAVPIDDPICGGHTSEECSLHLHGEASADPRFSTIRSHDVSPGLVLSAGNTGRKLALGDDAVDLFLSRDGGISWRRIKTGRWLYAFSDHGGLIVVAAHGYTTVVSFSLDEGKSWAPFTFEKDEVLVKKIVYNPYHPTSRRVVLHATTASQESRVYRLDFSGLDEARRCEGLANPNDPSSDYEWWTPKAQGEKCDMGRLVKYALRKADRICWDESGAVRTVAVTNCSCTWDDYECDYGYYEAPDSDGTPLCKPDPKIPLREPECKDGVRRISHGYVKMADNWCVGGLQVGVTYQRCGGWGPGRRWLAPLGAVLAAGAGYVLCRGRLLRALQRDLGYRRTAQEDEEEDDFDVEDDPALFTEHDRLAGADPAENGPDPPQGSPPASTVTMKAADPPTATASAEPAAVPLLSAPSAPDDEDFP